MEKINSITRCISKFISLIYFSIKITINEYLAKNGGHLSPGNILDTLQFFRQGLWIGAGRVGWQTGPLAFRREPEERHT